MDLGAGQGVFAEVDRILCVQRGHVLPDINIFPQVPRIVSGDGPLRNTTGASPPER
jgi:hypothetical protein